ncbi:MAG: SIMPL domain-containing protein [Bdellovibrionaceae bacterium]|nr:SIMPL domain-containing protein [Bdellovibrionales bacterium]MCB9083016.1 SIMPL domain-containing protein [Pseudobdellovibrionaceae bacterium]
MRKLYLAVPLSIAIVVLGAFVHAGLRYLKNFDKTVNVKGLAERVVKSDLAIWQVNFKMNSDEVKNQYLEYKRIKGKVKALIEKGGFSSDDLDFDNINITDNRDSMYVNKNGVKHKLMPRYTGYAKFTLTTNRVDQLRQLSGQVDELVLAGVSISRSDVYYKFESLNEIKAEMIKEATLNARDAAKSFAANANNNVRGIRRADQGYFEIRDSGTIENWSDNRALFKKVRVVTNLSFFLD